MRRGLLGLAVAGLLAAPAAAAPPSQPQAHEFHWSFESGRGRLGIEVESINHELRQHFGAPADRGVLVAHVEPNTAAASAGLQVGDVITDVAGKPAGEVRDVIAALADAKKGEHVTIAVVRDGKPLALDATMTDDPMPARAAPPTDPQELEHIQRDMERSIREMLHDMPWFQNAPGGAPGSVNT